jgi:hypothetical protein
VPRL